jgi:hypothetical protein
VTVDFAVGPGRLRVAGEPDLVAAVQASFTG